MADEDTTAYEWENNVKCEIITCEKWEPFRLNCCSGIQTGPVLCSWRDAFQGLTVPNSSSDTGCCESTYRSNLTSAYFFNRHERCS